MKRLFILLLSMGLTYTLHAQVMSSKAEWVTIKSANLKCWECKDRLEKYLAKANQIEMEGGVIQYKFNLLAGEIRFQFNPDRVDADMIRVVMNNAGFDADEEKAEPTAYKKLPPACKRPEEGGGPQKGKPCHLPPPNQN